MHFCGWREEVERVRHTRGPWYVHPDERPNDPNVTEVATVGTDVIWSESRPGDDDACLIAAAPDLLEVARAYEQWEADLLQTDAAWRTADGLPRMTRPLYDRWMEIQEMRNRALAKARGEKA